MSGFLRPEAVALLTRWREVIGGIIALGVGLILVLQIGYVQQGLGFGLIVVAFGYIVLALRRLRFAGAADAPGVVSIDEGQIAYFAPSISGTIGGTIDRADLTELRLRNDHGRLSWFLVTDTHALAIPHDALGADQLFDAFSALPDLGPATLLQAIQSKHQGTAVVWRRRGRPGLTALR